MNGELPEMATNRKLTAEEKRWQAESDARTLAEANVIKTTAVRLNAAKAAAKRMAVEEKKKAAAMTKVSVEKKVSLAANPVKRTPRRAAAKKKSVRKGRKVRRK